MKKHMILLTALFSILAYSPSAQAKDSAHTKILLHDHRDLVKGFGTAGWVILPDITNAGRALFIAGPRFTAKDSTGQKDRWWLEVMGGVVVSQDIDNQTHSTPLIDIRFSPLALGKRFTHWINFQWIDVFRVRSGRWYLYYQLDANLPWQLGKVGIETENTFKPGQNSLSAGPHLIMAVGKYMKIATAYQWHRKYEGNQWWFRTVIDF